MCEIHTVNVSLFPFLKFHNFTIFSLCSLCRTQEFGMHAPKQVSGFHENLLNILLNILKAKDRYIFWLYGAPKYVKKFEIPLETLCQ